MKNFRISSLEINEIGPFGRLKLDFLEKPSGFLDRAEIHILTGENGTGKTTMLEILVAAIEQSSNRLVAKCRWKDERSLFRVYFSSGEIAQWFPQGRRTVTESGGPLNVYLKNLRDILKNDFPTAFFAYSGSRSIEDVEISGIEELKGHPFEDVLNFRNSIKPGVIIQWIANTITKEALAKNQSDLQEATQFRAALTNLEETISGIIDKTVRFRLEYDPLTVTVEVDREKLSFNQLPDGLKSVISWVADLLIRMDRMKWEGAIPVFERNFILFLDEIEIHLHPAWQRKILPAVQKLFPNAQIFISTHSPFVVGSVDGAWIHKLVKPNGDSQLASPPILSEDAHSFRYWLDEVFDIKKEFGEGPEKQLDEFYSLRDALLLNGSAQERERLIQIARDLSGQSPEMDAIISWELRQINKRTNQSLAL